MTENLNIVPNPEYEAFRPFICHTCNMEITSPTMHGWVRTGNFTQSEHIPAGQASQIIPCPTCSDSARRERITAQVDRLLGQSHIPLRMAEWSFSSLPIDIDTTAKTRAVFFANKQTPKHGMYFYGLPGQGKTGLAISIIQAVMRRGEDALFIRSSNLFDRLREAIHKSKSANNYKEYEPLYDEMLMMVKQVKWLALDDLAVEKPTDYVIKELKTIIEHRMDYELYTIITSNLSLKDLDAYWRSQDMQVGTDYFHAGRRVVERIGEYVEGVKLDGRNLRRKEQQG